MGVPAVGQVYLLTLRGEISNQITLNTFMYQCTNVGSAATTQEIVADIITDIKSAAKLVPKFLNVMPTDYQLFQEWVQVISPLRLAKQTFSDGNFGASGLTANTANVAATIERRGDVADRKNVGSLHLVAPDPASIATNGTITLAAYLTAINTLAAQMLVPIVGAVTGANLVPVLFNPRAPGNPPRRITATIAQNEIRVMRRRTVRVGI